MAVEKVCLEPEELMMMVSFEGGEFYIQNLETPSMFPFSSFSRVTLDVPFNHTHKQSPEDLMRGEVAQIVRSNPPLYDLLQKGEIHAFEYGPLGNGRDPDKVVFYEVLDEKLLGNWLEYVRSPRYESKRDAA